MSHTFNLLYAAYISMGKTKNWPILRVSGHLLCEEVGVSLDYRDTTGLEDLPLASFLIGPLTR